MALDPRIILGLRPLASPAELQDDRDRREINRQEVELRRQDIDLRRQALQQRGIGQPKPFDPVAAGHEMDYRTKQIVTVSNLLKRAKTDPSSYPQVRSTIGQLVPDAISHLPAEYDDATISGIIADGDSLVAKETKTGTPQLLEMPDPDDPTKTIRKYVIPRENDVYPGVPKSLTAKASNLGSFEDYVTRTYGENPTSAQILKARKEYNQSDDKATGGGGGSADGDTQAIADAIARGEQPPTLQGLYSRGAAVRAALAKKGYNLADAQTDWGATQAHMRTLNGSQQTRMRQAVDNAYHSMDVIEDLAKQWDGGRFPILNKAKLSAAKAGALGPKAQQIATQLEAQISDVTSELGNVYMGGNSPTDHALGLAAKNLSADWTRDQLRAAIALARKNLEIRSNSMKNVGVAGASEGNPYAPSPAQAPPPPSAAPAKPSANPFRK